MAAVVFFPVPGCEEDRLGFQFRHAVQILQGLPSGPMTMPGGNVGVVDTELALLISSSVVTIEAVGTGWRTGPHVTISYRFPGSSLPS